MRTNAVALALTPRWAKVSAVLFAIGAVSGTVLSFEMGLLWPGLMGTFGDVLGLPFALEGLSFFVEAIFLGIYLYGWGRFTIAGVYAVGMLRGRRDAHHRLWFLIPFSFASVAAIVQPVIGHLLGGGLGDRQPAKLAAFELATTTESPSPLRIGGLLIDGEVHCALDVPVLGSLIAQIPSPRPFADWTPSRCRTSPR
ncbi:hypothetical protein GCM10027063_39550 [Promicromonospora xylanilytica]